MAPKRMHARITEEDLRFSPEVRPSEARETWERIIAAAWDMTIVSVAYNDVRVPLGRVPETLRTLEEGVPGVTDAATLDIIEEELKTGIRHFSEMMEGIQKSKETMERLLRATWNRRLQLK